MKIVDGFFTDAGDQATARHMGGARKPGDLYIIAHDTAGGSADSTVKFMETTDVPVSYHIIIARDGTFTQMVDLDRIAYHAGRSQHPRKPWVKGLNKCSIGIAFANPGELDASGKSWFGKIYGDHIRVEGRGRVAWFRPYTDQQKEAFTEIVEAIEAQYGVTEILSHHAIAPGRKNDTGPHLDPFLRGLNNAIEDKAADGEPSANAVVNAHGLNMRSGPSIGHDVLTVLPIGTKVRLQGFPLRSGYVLASVGERSGWLHSDYLIEVS